MQWWNRGHFHCRPFSRVGYGGKPWMHFLSPSFPFSSFWSQLMACLWVKQGQIKTGAPCRSERLAKYNQVSCVTSGFDTIRFSELRTHLMSFFFSTAAEDWGRAWVCCNLCGGKVPSSSRALLIMNLWQFLLVMWGCSVWDFELFCVNTEMNRPK